MVQFAGRVRGLFWLAIVAQLLLITSFASATRIYGTVYDSSFAPLQKAIVTVNTTPRQYQVATNGSYEFSVPNGSVYRIYAQRRNSSAFDDVVVLGEGEFRIDLIAFPRVSQSEQEIENFTKILGGNEITEYGENGNNLLPLIALVAFLALLAGAALFLHKTGLNQSSREAGAAGAEKHGGEKIGEADSHLSDRPLHISLPKTLLPPLPEIGRPLQTPLTPDQQKVLETIRRFDNRLSQKELRKALSPWSEAKVSMELTELEDRGIISKIKKGRGNIIRAG